MVVGIKDTAKLIGIIIISFCAVLVCTMFMNYYIDVKGVRGEIISEQAMIFYEAQVSTAKVVCGVCGGCLLTTSVIMLMFYIRHYIDTHKKELGILKALGYSNRKIAGNFWVFGSSILIGTALGFAGAFCIMPAFYRVQNKEKLLPEMAVGFHSSLLLYLVVVPTAVFALLAIGYAWYKLKMPVMSLLRNSLPGLHETGKRRKKGVSKRSEDGQNDDGKSGGRQSGDNRGGGLFLDDLRKNTLRDKKVLAFFILFASFCFSSMTQMSFSMKELSSVMMGVMMMLIGLVLASTTLFLAITTVINGNTKTIAMMRVFGYSQRECCRAILGGYRPVSYVGFAVGTVYQYVLLRIMVDVVFRDMEGMPAYEFDFPAMLVSLAVFILVYEAVMYAYSERIKKISVKEIMLE